MVNEHLSPKSHYFHKMWNTWLLFKNNWGKKNLQNKQPRVCRGSFIPLIYYVCRKGKNKKQNVFRRCCQSRVLVWEKLEGAVKRRGKDSPTWKVSTARVGLGAATAHPRRRPQRPLSRQILSGQKVAVMRGTEKHEGGVMPPVDIILMFSQQLGASERADTLLINVSSLNGSLINSSTLLFLFFEAIFTFPASSTNCTTSTSTHAVGSD